MENRDTLAFPEGTIELSSAEKEAARERAAAIPPASARGREKGRGEGYLIRHLHQHAKQFYAFHHCAAACRGVAFSISTRASPSGELQLEMAR